MVMKFPNGETRNLLIEVFNYKRVCAQQICYTSGFGGQRHGHKFESVSLEEWLRKRLKICFWSPYLLLLCFYVHEIYLCSCSKHDVCRYYFYVCKPENQKSQFHPFYSETFAIKKTLVKLNFLKSETIYCEIISHLCSNLQTKFDKYKKNMTKKSF